MSTFDLNFDNMNSLIFIFVHFFLQLYRGGASDDADWLVPGTWQRRSRSLLNGQQHKSHIVSADVAQGLQQIGHSWIFAFGPVGEQMARRSRLFLQRALFKRCDPWRCVAQIARQSLPVALIPTSVQHHLHLATLGGANVSQPRV